MPEQIILGVALIALIAARVWAGLIFLKEVESNPRFREAFERRRQKGRSVEKLLA
jgi:hypothetical protein